MDGLSGLWMHYSYCCCAHAHTCVHIEPNQFGGHNMYVPLLTALALVLAFQRGKGGPQFRRKKKIEIVTKLKSEKEIHMPKRYLFHNLLV